MSCIHTSWEKIPSVWKSLKKTMGTTTPSTKPHPPIVNSSTPECRRLLCVWFTFDGIDTRQYLIGKERGTSPDNNKFSFWKRIQRHNTVFAAFSLSTRRPMRHSKTLIHYEKTTQMSCTQAHANDVVVQTYTMGSTLDSVFEWTRFRWKRSTFSIFLL